MLLYISIVNAADMPEGFITYHLSKDEVKELCDIGRDYDALNGFFASKYFEERTLFWVDDEKNEYYYEVKKYDKDGNIYNSDLICSVPGEQVADSIFDSDSFPFTDKAIEDILRINNISESVNSFYVIESAQKVGYYSQPEYMVYVITDNAEYILCITFDTDELYYGTISSCDNLKFGFKAYTKNEFLNEYYGDSYIQADQERNLNIYIDGTKLDYNKSLKSYGVSFNMPLSDILGYIGAEIKRVPASNSRWYKERHDSDMKTMRNIADMEGTEFNEAEFNENYKLSDFYRITLNDTAIDIYYDWNGYPLNDNELLINSSIKNDDKNNIYCSSSSLKNILSRLGYCCEIDIDNAIADIFKKISVYVNNERIDFASEPIMENDRTLVPMRRIFEELGAAVTWDNDTNTATAVKDNIEIKITADSDTMLKNGEPIKLDAPARLINDAYTYVPFRAIAEALNCAVKWNENINTVEIIDVGDVPSGWSVNSDVDSEITEFGYYKINNLAGCFSKCGEFSDGLAVSSRSSKWADKKYYGYVDKNGVLIIPDIYTEASDFEGGIATVKSDFYDYPYHINVRGEIVDDIKLNSNIVNTIDAEENFIIYKDKGLYGYKNKTDGETVIGASYSRAWDFSDGIALVNTRGINCVGTDQYDGIRYINSKGQLISENEYLIGSDLFSEGLAFVVSANDNDEYEGYYIDKNGDRVFGDKTFVFGDRFVGGYAAVQISGRNKLSPLTGNDNKAVYSYINKSGEFVTEKQFDYAESFKDGYAIVEKNGNKYKINTKFEIVETL